MSVRNTTVDVVTASRLAAASRRAAPDRSSHCYSLETRPYTRFNNYGRRRFLSSIPMFEPFRIL
jgi:hypothetical protein